MGGHSWVDALYRLQDRVLSEVRKDTITIPRQLAQHYDCGAAEWDTMVASGFHTFSRDHPQAATQIYFLPRSKPNFSGSASCEDQKLSCSRALLFLLAQRAHKESYLLIRQRSVIDYPLYSRAFWQRRF